jgi:hypothetical protein
MGAVLFLKAHPERAAFDLVQDTLGCKIRANPQQRGMSLRFAGLLITCTSFRNVMNLRSPRKFSARAIRTIETMAVD